jgi:hypothetical protein
MKKLTNYLLLLLLFPGTLHAQQLSMTWGLENTWSYRELHQGRTYEQDAAYRPESGGKRYRTFEFIEGKKDVDEPRFECLERHFQLWEAYQAAIKEGEIPSPPKGDPDSERRAFVAYKTQMDPFCTMHADKQAPALYFDFIADSPHEYVLRHIEITTLRFSEYMAGGFIKEQAGYDIVLSHKEGTKIVNIERKLAFSGHGRVELRFWSDNYYPKQGWIVGPGEYMIDICFVFSVAGGVAKVATGPFKIDLM